MPRPGLRDGAYPAVTGGKDYPTVVKAVNVTLTSNTAVAVWTPATGRKFKYLGADLTVSVGTLLATTVAGDLVVLYDNAATLIFQVVGVIFDAALVAGSLFGTGIQSDTAFAAATTAQATGSKIDHVQHFGPYFGGYQSAAANNVMKAAIVKGTDLTAQSIGSGVIQIVGTIYGHEV